MKQKLIELIAYAKQIASAKCYGYVLCNNCPNKKYEGRCKDNFMAEELIANGVTIQKWIPSYEYPKETGFYICWYKSPYGEDLWKVGQCYWNGTNWTTVGFMPLVVQVKQYTPLPEPPKGE